MVITDPVKLTDASITEDIVIAVHMDPRAASFAERHSSAIPEALKP